MSKYTTIAQIKADIKLSYAKILDFTREFQVQINRYDGDGLNLYQYCQANPVGYVDPRRTWIKNQIWL